MDALLKRIETIRKTEKLLREIFPNLQETDLKYIFQIVCGMETERNTLKVLEQVKKLKFS